MTKKKSVLKDSKMSVSLGRNGLYFEVKDVLASDSGLVAKELLDMMRTLVKAGYDELVPDAGSTHAGPFGDVPDDDGEASEDDPPAMIQRKRIGF